MKNVKQRRVHMVDLVMRYTVSLRASQNIIFFDTYCFPDIYIILYILNYLN